ncbi:addiction module protein [Candidatus Sumerlaeota bacterium]|nr:addiction module protein [Candidatus Sumerlaeota bacterium]
MGKTNISDLLELSVSKRLILVEDLWDSIASVPEALSLTESQKEELNRRIEAHRRDPSAVSPWEEVRARILGSR